MQELRRKDRGISREEAWSILHKAEYGVLSTVSQEGLPYGVPLSFCVIDGSVYFHCAVEGRKIDNMATNNAVSFCTVGDIEVLPEKFGVTYQSTIIFGKAEEVFGSEKQASLEGLIKKYSPNFTESGAKYIEALTDKTRVFKIVVDHISGKSRKN